MNKAYDILLNPIEFLIDWIVRLIVYFFVPIPLAAEMIVQFRGIVFAFLLNGILVILVLIIFLTHWATNPLSTQQALANVNLPIDGTFIETDIPLQNPLGGQGLTLVNITAGYMDPNYTFFGGIHTGVDFVPNDAYYQSNTTYKETGTVVVYSTINGTARYYIDQYGSHTIEIVNSKNNIKVIFMHLNNILVATGDTISAGKPVGTMGNTGFTTGEHLHYEIRENHDGNWIPVNPLGYIQ